MTTYTEFIKTIKTYYRAHRRSFPWRETTDPYCIFVSEIMLQQTQADRVIRPYTIFIERFPNWQSLAEAPLRDVLTLWKGLGYNRRAISLKRSAEAVVHTYNGSLPKDKDALLSFPGIGPATAGDIRAFAWNIPDIVIETNIRTVYIHHFFSETTARIRDADLIPHVEATLDRKNPRDWYYALMDYGSMLKKSVGNIAARSSLYAKQSTYKGSKRELRARLLFLITDSPKKIVQLSHETKTHASQIHLLLSELEREGLIEENHGTWYIHGDASKN